MTLTLPDEPCGLETAPVVSRFTLMRLSLMAYVRAIRNRRAAMHIAELPDCLLNDLGLRRDDVDSALRASWREDPTYRLAACARYRRYGG